MHNLMGNYPFKDMTRFYPSTVDNPTLMKCFGIDCLVAQHGMIKMNFIKR
jgi:hypothetical protein